MKTMGPSSQIDIPNLSGVQKEALRTGTAIMQEGDSHTLLSDIGTNTHAQIDTAITNSVAHIADNTQAHSDYMLNTGYTATGNYTFDTNTFFIDSTNDRVGIGTTGPTSPLHVKSDAGTQVKFEATTGTNSIISIHANTGGNFYVGREGSVAGNTLIGSLAYAGIIGGDPVRPIQFFTSNAARMIIDENGNVGIKTTTPDQLLSLGAGSFASANTTAPTLTLSRVSGSFFISGGSFFYKGDKGTVTELAPR